MSILIESKIEIKDSKTALDVVSVAYFNEYAYEDRGRDSLVADLIKSSYSRIQKYLGLVILKSTVTLKYRNYDVNDVLDYSNNASNAIITTDGIFTIVTFEAGYEKDAVQSWIKISICKQVAYDLNHLGDENIEKGIVSKEVAGFLAPFKKITI